ncbi:uncharacterized protein K460DRAFT_415467 [Cucurbitaria berberidis CBS 394.84]|uniref:Uncharacterized protein n=1 Tax=Cucurbitaria berberidis CBS 394.84 TaxID=1168544 RepID=A0A9P4GPN3_9PLEO|nr:uncharacterized protein K460DRAFT_415467 [Cucurbitaria berberidis CBS 394.84]KAF1849027.1 hypothetical protein K460DRAFT_415467 [Cucurbitaria berberidis CBS 394.84]
MPFRDGSWEDFQRDCALFPAYTDYIFGPDLRPEVTNEPGLHPMLFPPQPHAPIRYTNSFPSRTRTYSGTQGFMQPRNGAKGPQSRSGEDMAYIGLGREDSGSSITGMDLRSHIGSSISDLIPPQSVRPVSVAEMTSRRMLNASQRRPLAVSLATLDSSKPFPRNFLRQAQVENGPNPWSGPAGRAPDPSLVRSSSATDVDEQLAQMAARRGPMLSPSASPSPLLSYPARLPQHQSHQVSLAASNPLPSAHTHLQAQATQNSTLQIPLVQPDDLVSNPRYFFVAYENRRKLNEQIIGRWDIVDSQSSTELRAQAMMEIEHVSQSLYNATRKYEEEVRQNMELKRQVRASAEQHGYMQPPSESLLQSPNFHTAPQLGSRQQSPIPAQQLSPHSPKESLLPPQQPPRQISQELRIKIDAVFPTLWRCLQVVNALPPGSPPFPLDLVAEKQQAHHWLSSFKAKLPLEGHQYVEQVVMRMWKAKAEGRDVLEEIGK